MSGEIIRCEKVPANPIPERQYKGLNISLKK